MLSTDWPWAPRGQGPCPSCSLLRLSVCLAHSRHSTNTCPLDEKMKGRTCLCSPPSSCSHTPHSLYTKYTYDASPCHRAIARALPSAWNALPLLLSLTFTVSFGWLLLPLFQILAQASLPGLSVCLTYLLLNYTFTCVIISTALVYLWSYPVYLSMCQLFVSSQTHQGLECLIHKYLPMSPTIVYGPQKVLIQ